jgi:hypothetical protein
VAAYPTFGQLQTTKETWQDKVEFERASNGTLRGRALWPSDKLTLIIEHVLTRAELETMLGFYRDNRLLPVDVTYYAESNRAEEPVVRSMFFAAPPEVTRLRGNYWTVTTTMVQA